MLQLRHCVSTLARGLSSRLSSQTLLLSDIHLRGCVAFPRGQPGTGEGLGAKAVLLCTPRGLQDMSSRLNPHAAGTRGPLRSPAPLCSSLIFHQTFVIELLVRRLFGAPHQSCSDQPLTEKSDWNMGYEASKQQLSLIFYIHKATFITKHELSLLSAFLVAWISAPTTLTSCF